MTAGTVPILIAAPFLLIWFGVGRASAVSLVAFYVAVILYLFAERAARNLDPDLREFCADARRRTGAASFATSSSRATVPEILGGFRIALAGAWGLEAVAELLGVADRASARCSKCWPARPTPRAFSPTLLLLGLVALVADALRRCADRALRRLERRQPDRLRERRRRDAAAATNRRMIDA